MASKKTSNKKTTTKKTTTKKAATKKTVGKASLKKKRVANKTETKEKPVTKTQARVDPADVIWEEVKNLPINMYAMMAKVSDHVTRVHGVPGKLCVRFKSGAALPALEESLKELTQSRVERTSVGDPVNVQYPKYEMVETDLFVIIKPFVPVDERPETQTKAGSFVVVPSGKTY